MSVPHQNFTSAKKLQHQPGKFLVIFFPNPLDLHLYIKKAREVIEFLKNINKKSEYSEFSRSRY